MASVFSQNLSLSGYVEDVNTGERIIGAYVTDTMSKQVCQTNNFGFFSLKTAGNNAALHASYIGLRSRIVNLSLKSDTVISIQMEPVMILDEVIVSSSQYERNLSSPPGLVIVPVTNLSAVPALGETDLLKSIQILPGIKGGIEGSAGVFVRGGSGGENLFMLDDVPLYNVSHLYGFFSAFNSSAIKDIKIIKGSFPARYGGRTSSVIDVRSRDGNNKSLKGEAALSLISAKFTLEGPVTDNNTTFIVSGRRSYFDLYSGALKSMGLADEDFPGYKFHDLNIRLVSSISSRNKIYLGFYSGNNRIIYEEKEAFMSSTETISQQNRERSGWGNITGSFRWNHLFGTDLFSNTTIAFSSYDFFIKKHYSYAHKKPSLNSLVEKKYIADYMSGISDLIVKTDFEFAVSNNHKMVFGAGSNFHSFNPGKNIFIMENQEESISIDTAFTNPVLTASEPFIYIEDEADLTKKIKINAGVRFSGYMNEGNAGLNIEPRFSASYSLFPVFAVKAGYSRMTQNMHLVSATGVTMPTDFWVPAAKGLQPLKSDQVNVGISYELNNKLFLTIEAYRKWLYNTADLKNGASMLNSLSPWYEKLTQGHGDAKGIELSLEKYTGIITGSINYTLSAASRNYPDLNEGNSFPFRYDRLHDFNVSVNYKISGKWDISAVWIYGTGYPLTVPVEKYSPGLGNVLPGQVHYYPSINNFKLPDYHRLDLGLHYRKHSRLGESIFSLDLFNAYNRKNPVNISFYNVFTYEYTYLLPIVPSLSYCLKF